MKNILSKLMEIQKLNLSVEKDEKNPFFKSSYISLDNLVSKLAPYLNERGLLVYHYTDNNCITTVVADVESSETVVSNFPMIESNDPQKLGSCISYAKRYNLGQLFNIITDRDDDGNIASDKEVEKKVFGEMELGQLKTLAMGWDKEKTMQQILKIKREYSISKEIGTQIDLFLKDLK